jgi:predicted 3-demethylubiquinone-9 3-methyltransferase (glyoxalase superfamily)
MEMQKISPFLWFDTQAEDAAKFYTSIFKNSKITTVNHYPESSPVKPGEVLVAVFEVEGMQFMALNGGPEFKFNPSVSFQVTCEDQEEVDYFWSKLTADGGKESQCGWLADKFGLSWQITPKVLGELLSDPDPAKSGRVMAAMMQMLKIDIQTLRDAYDGK